MRDEHTDAGKVVVSKRSPQTLVEATHAIIGIRCTLAVRYAVEEVAIVGPLLPHALHFGRAWLEVAEILLPYPGLLEDGDLVAGKGRGRGVVRRQRAQDALCRLACPAVGRGIELEGIVGLEQRAELAPSLFCLGPAMLGQLYPVIGNKLVDVAVLVSLGLRMADQNNHLRRRQP